MAAPSYTYTLTNGTTADASQVMQDFNDILNGVTDGTKDLTMSALTANGAANLKAAVTLGQSSANLLAINCALNSSLAINTNNSFTFGSSTKGLAGIYMGNGGVGSTCQILSASHATTRNYTIPDCGAAANFVMTQGTQTISGATTFVSVVNAPQYQTSGSTATVAGSGGNNELAGNSHGLVVLNGYASGSGAFNIVGLTNGVDGAIVTVVNETGGTMTVVHNSASASQAANKILLSTGANQNIAGSNGTVTFIYSSNQSRWFLIAYQA